MNKCPICKVNTNNLYDHMLSEHYLYGKYLVKDARSPIICKVCGATQGTYACFVRHVDLAHNGPQHTRKLINEEFKTLCPLCKKSVHKNYMRQHFFEFHPQIVFEAENKLVNVRSSNIICLRCGAAAKGFKGSGGIVRHYRDSHKEHIYTNKPSLEVCQELADERKLLVASYIKLNSTVDTGVLPVISNAHVHTNACAHTESLGLVVEQQSNTLDAKQIPVIEQPNVSLSDVNLFQILQDAAVAFATAVREKERADALEAKLEQVMQEKNKTEEKAKELSEKAKELSSDLMTAHSRYIHMFNERGSGR